MKNLMKGIKLFLIILFMTGCMKAVIRSDSDPSINLAELEKFYVRQSPTDERGLEKIVASKLNAFGFQATSGMNTTPTDPVDVIVTYKDWWSWDITMYMLEINIEFRNPDSDFVFASGRSYRTSLVRKSPDEMIDEVLRDMFAGKVDLPEKKVDDNKEE